ncbi:DUF134 domain-containing protein [Sulfurimonas marina]|uniref:DUF134 domain-containing protein n=1 Tax=Sulfurimonas marina TaxID=2590551 RepID=A0A7M1AWU9_9BACT|nr:DUF134 domain-containing protein [Sulfurimonas marina]QOP41914.1 DUF134 domain-containing protein [Sulfurimonas marina]
MARTKSNRNLNFKPQYKKFVPEGVKPDGKVTLLHEEIEAIYLMDLIGLYQEEAAKKMEISRPTFTRILKNARYKLSLGIVSGYKIEIEDDKDEIIVAICMENEDNFEKISPMEQYIFVYKMTQDKVSFIKKLENPVYSDKKKLAIVLPKLFLEHNVNLFVSSQIGEGLKNSLISKGIKPMIVKKMTSLETLLQ